MMKKWKEQVQEKIKDITPVPLFIRSELIDENSTESKILYLVAEKCLAENIDIKNWKWVDIHFFSETDEPIATCVFVNEEEQYAIDFDFIKDNDYPLGGYVMPLVVIDSNPTYRQTIINFFNEKLCFKHDAITIG